jgi:nitrogen regulatory protein PII
MKLIILTTIEEFAKEVKHILKNAQVKSYSYKNVIGYLSTSEEAFESNWFGVEMDENESILFYAFVPKDTVDKVYDAVKEFNAKQKTASHMHIAVLNIEKSN